MGVWIWIVKFFDTVSGRQSNGNSTSSMGNRYMNSVYQWVNIHCEGQPTFQTCFFLGGSGYKWL